MNHHLLVGGKVETMPPTVLYVNEDNMQNPTPYMHPVIFSLYCIGNQSTQEETELKSIRACIVWEVKVHMKILD